MRWEHWVERWWLMVGHYYYFCWCECCVTAESGDIMVMDGHRLQTNFQTKTGCIIQWEKLIQICTELGEEIPAGILITQRQRGWWLKSVDCWCGRQSVSLMITRRQLSISPPPHWLEGRRRRMINDVGVVGTQASKYPWTMMIFAMSVAQCQAYLKCI